MSHSDKFWFDDPSILISPDRLTEFFPNKSFSLNEKLNSLARLGMYVSIVLVLHDKNVKWFSVFLFSLLLTYYIHVNQPEPSPKKEESNKTIERFDDVTSEPRKIRSVAPDIIQPELAQVQPSEAYSQIIADLQDEEIQPEEPSQNAECTKPTLDNPFMNMTMKDYLNFDKAGNIVNRQPGCDTSDPEIKKSIDDNFKNNLFRDVNDVFGRFNSERQFYTMPWTEIIPDVKGEFKHWLYNNPKTCKEDQDNCLLYEDIRAKRPVL
jgi:hypothetical protein